MMTSTLPAHGPASELEWLQSFAERLAANDSDDLVQETAISALTRTDDAPPSRPWLATVMRNHFRMGHRSAMRRRVRESRVQADRVDTLAPDDAAHRLQVLRALVERLEALPSEDRRIIVARHFDGRNATEIGQALGLPAATVRSRLNRSLRRLRRELDERFGGERITWAAAVGVPSSGAMPGSAGATLALMSAKQVVGALVAIFAAGSLFWLANRSRPEPDSAPDTILSAQGDETHQADRAAATPTDARAAWLDRRAAIEVAREQLANSEKTEATNAPDPSNDVQELVDQAHEAQAQAVLDCNDRFGGPLVGALVLRSRVMGAPDIGTIFETIDIVGETENDPELVECVRDGMYAFVGAPPSEPFEQLSTVTTLGARPPDQDDDAWLHRIVSSVVTAHLSEVRACEAEASQPPVGSVALSLTFEDDAYPADAQVEARNVPAAVAECIARKASTWMFPRPMLADRTFTQELVLPIDPSVDGEDEQPEG